MICDNDYEKLTEIYEIIRGNLNLYFVWPKHKNPTINTLKYAKYKDRIDCLIYDLKMYSENQQTLVKRAYESEKSKLWFSQFKDFEDFINKMKLNNFVDENYQIYDLSKNNFEYIT